MPSSVPQYASDRYPKPRLEIFVAPKSPVQASTQKALIAPVSAPVQLADQFAEPLGELLQSVFLQHQVFSTTARLKSTGLKQNAILDQAAIKGFDYVIFPYMPSIIVPSGNSKGWVAASIKIVSTKNRLTIWNIYGESYLSPKPSQYILLHQRPYEPAPSVTQGFTALFRAMADVVGGKGVYIVPGHP